MKATGSTAGYADVGSTTGTVTAIPSIVGLELPEVAIDDIDVSTLDSETLKYDPGDIEPGEGKVTSLYTKADFSTLYALKGVKKSWTFTQPDTGKHTGDGYIKSIRTANDRKSGVIIEMSIKMSGPITHAAT